MRGYNQDSRTKAILIRFNLLCLWPGPVDEVHERRALLADQAGMGRYQQQDPRRAAGPRQEPLAKGHGHAHSDRVANGRPPS